MRTQRAIELLRQLRNEAVNRGVELNEPGPGNAWKGQVRSVLTSCFGPQSHIVESFDEVRYGLSIWFASTPDSEWDAAFLDGLSSACGVIDAALFELNERVVNDELLDDSAFDLELWDHVKVQVEHEEWQKVASQTAIFVEDRVRRWVGNPREGDGRTKVGKSLFLAALNTGSDYQLGSEAGESEGWRALGTGFAQALSNVDRHNIQDRADAKRYAFGVLGLGSLILTQLRYQHGDKLQGN